MLSVGVLRSGHWNKPSNSTGRPCCTGTDSPPVIRCRRASPSHSGVIAIRPRPDRSRVPRRGGATGLAPETSSPLRTRGPRAVHPGENRMATPVVCSSEGMPSGSASGASQPPSPPVRAPHAPMTNRAPRLRTHRVSATAKGGDFVRVAPVPSRYHTGRPAPVRTVRGEVGERPAGWPTAFCS
jgi:hypothetical protein